MRVQEVCDAFFDIFVKPLEGEIKMEIHHSFVTDEFIEELVEHCIEKMFFHKLANTKLDNGRWRFNDEGQVAMYSVPIFNIDTSDFVEDKILSLDIEKYIIADVERAEKLVKYMDENTAEEYEQYLCFVDRSCW